MARVGVVVGLLGALAGCSSRALSSRDVGGARVEAGAAASTDAGTEAGAPASTDAGTGAGADARPDASCTDPRFPQLHICCGQPGEIAERNCVDPSTIAPGCVGEGESADFKNYVVCCEGLSPIGIEHPFADPAAGAPLCDMPFPLESSHTCARCGDGNCGPGENPCNCPRDCGEPH